MNVESLSCQVSTANRTSIDRRNGDCACQLVIKENDDDDDDDDDDVGQLCLALIQAIFLVMAAVLLIETVKQSSIVLSISTDRRPHSLTAYSLCSIASTT